MEVKILENLYEYDKGLFKEDYTVEDAIRQSKVLRSKLFHNKYVRVVPLDSHSEDFLATIIDLEIHEVDIETYASKAGMDFLDFVERKSIEDWLETTTPIMRIQKLDDFNGCFFENIAHSINEFLSDSFPVFPTHLIHEELLAKGGASQEAIIEFKKGDDK